MNTAWLQPNERCFQMQVSRDNGTLNIQRCHEIHSVCYPLCTVATAVTATCKYHWTDPGRGSKLHAKSAFNHITLLLSLSLFPAVSANTCADVAKESNHILCEGVLAFLNYSQDRPIKRHNVISAVNLTPASAGFKKQTGNKEDTEHAAPFLLRLKNIIVLMTGKVFESDPKDFVNNMSIHY